MTAPDLSRELFGHTFQNPILLAAGTAGYGRELDGVMDLDRLGGIVTKAVSLAPRAGNPAPRVAEFPGGMLNSVGLANPGLAEVRARDLPWLIGRLRRARIVVNIVGFTETEYAEVIAGLDDLEGISAWELNLSCPNVSGGLDLSQVPLQNVDRIEVLRGSQSALYGSDAIGGVIQIITRSGGPPSAQAQVEAGSRDMRRAAAATTA